MLMPQASSMTCEAPSSGGIEWLSSLEAKQGEEEEVRWGEGGNGRQRARQAVQIYCLVGSVVAPTAISWGPALGYSAMGTVVLDGQIYVCGGYDGNSSLNSVESYSPETNK